MYAWSPSARSSLGALLDFVLLCRRRRHRHRHRHQYSSFVLLEYTHGRHITSVDGRDVQPPTCAGAFVFLSASVHACIPLRSLLLSFLLNMHTATIFTPIRTHTRTIDRTQREKRAAKNWYGVDIHHAVDLQITSVCRATPCLCMYTVLLAAI